MQVLTFLLCICLMLTACSSQKDDVIKIGASAQLSGAEAKMGADFKNAVTLAVNEINASGGLLGKRVEVIFGDDQADPKQAVAVANKFVNEKVIAVIGHFNSSCSIPASDIYSKHNIPMITPASTNPLLTQRGLKNVFRVCGTDEQQGKVAATFAQTVLKAKNIAVIHDKTTYGQGLADLFKKNIQAANIVYYGGITKGDKDFKAVLTTIKQRPVDLIFFGGVYPEAGLLIKQAREVGINAVFLSGDGSIDPKFVEIAGEKSAEGSYMTFSPDYSSHSNAKDFLNRYKSTYGDVGPYSIYSYTATKILFDAIKSAGSTDSNAIISKLRTMKFDTPMGAISFDEKGDVLQSPYVVWITEKGKFRQFWSESQK